MKTINQTMLFNGTPDEIYEALINPRKFSSITTGKATNDLKINGKFTAYDEYISGTNIELVPGKKIVQKWTCEDFPEGHFTDVKIELKKKGERQTELVFTQDNVPDDFYEDISLGWNEFYWEPIKDWLEEKMWK